MLLLVRLLYLQLCNVQTCNGTARHATCMNPELMWARRLPAVSLWVEVVLDRSPLLCVIDPMQERGSSILCKPSITIRLGIWLRENAVLGFVLRRYQYLMLHNFDGLVADGWWIGNYIGVNCSSLVEILLQHLPEEDDDNHGGLQDICCCWS